MKSLFALLWFLLFCSAFLFGIVSQAQSDELDNITKQINDLTSALNQSKAATAPLESQLKSMQKQITDIKSRVSTIENDIAVKKKNIEEGYRDLAKQEMILHRTIRDFYIKSYYSSPLLIFLSADSASEITQLLAYQKAATDQDKVIITNIALSITDLETKKKTLEEEEIRLTEVKASLDEQSAKLDKIVSGAKSYQSSLSNQIAVLSAKQQQILSQRLSSLNIPLYAYNTQGGCSSDIGKDPGFSGGFGFFTYGVPNRIGLNQYGAWGRAKAGQDAEAILRAYYTFDSLTTVDTGKQINVEGHGSYSLEDYVKRIYEVPDSWTDNNLAALKAQAIAARSYVLAYTNNGAGSICTTEQCQVFKPDPKGGNWEQAVNATSGQVMIHGGSPIKAWFSSTHGGYVFSSSEIGWNGTAWTKNAKDTTSDSINSFDDLKNNAYDKDSPWFYCDWGSRSQYNKTAWLKSEEVADIVNVLLLVQKDGGTKEHLYQVDKSNPAGTDTWDVGRVKDELKNRGGKPFNNVSSLSTDWDKGSGKTTSVNVSGDAGSISFNGADFKTYFNLRAPANIQIVGPLYNVERS